MYNNLREFCKGRSRLRYTEKYSRGRRGAPAKGVGRVFPAREFKSLLLRHSSPQQQCCGLFILHACNEPICISSSPPFFCDVYEIILISLYERIRDFPHLKFKFFSKTPRQAIRCIFGYPSGFTFLLCANTSLHRRSVQCLRSRAVAVGIILRALHRAERANLSFILFP